MLEIGVVLKFCRRTKQGILWVRRRRVPFFLAQRGVVEEKRLRPLRKGDRRELPERRGVLWVEVVESEYGLYVIRWAVK
ncbi:hypothetical protein A2765_03385 [Candidatus Kaiserbacteria bacterium RIFCSPHIGHO2_01_FULL_56_24]|uniref:Uncharacterized protein n=1 Tax=Candidatus Kaiserbacteria bacterium RIFCSPHIGHO2_01_FULL_56_24 TaxID=1798487 RepID=A0A1F6D8Z2_9BACT|nr:MAG: hypothetical protein A2765_03385 [Candidatus Kaiserbacteria bacterium RIFCSPHIGHO2_01_FULL_56_24]